MLNIMDAFIDDDEKLTAVCSEDNATLIRRALISERIEGLEGGMYYSFEQELKGMPDSR